MDFMVIILCLYLIFTDTLEFSWSQEVYIVRQNMSWENANDSCTLLHGETITSTLLQQGQRAWTGKRILYTDWMRLEDCAKYTLNPTLFTTIKLSGALLTIECYDQCKRLDPESSVLRFALFQQDAEDLCLCHNSTSLDPSFGRRGNPCTPINCKRGTDEDLCGDGGLLIYRSYSTVNFKGPADCGAFTRTDNETVDAIAVSCEKKLGYLVEATQDPFNCTENRCLCVAVLDEGGSLSEESIDCNKELPALCINASSIIITTWSSTTSSESTASNMTTDSFNCTENRCLCVAVLDEGGSLSEESIDCNKELPALCINASSIIITISSSTTSSESTASNMTTEGILKPVIVSILVAALLVIFITVFIVFKRKGNRNNFGGHQRSDEPSFIHSKENINKKTIHDGNKAHTSTGVVSRLECRSNEGEKRTEIFSPPNHECRPTNRKEKYSYEQNYTTVHAAAETSDIYDHTDKGNKQDGELTNNEYGVVESDTGDIYNHTCQSSSVPKNEVIDDEYGVVKSESGDIYDHTCQSSLVPKNEVIDEEYGVVKSESGDIYAHGHQSSLQVMVDETDNYDTMAGARRDENNIYDHSHDGFLIPTTVSVATLSIVVVVTIVVIALKRKLKLGRNRRETQTDKEALPEYINTTLRGVDKEQETPYETTLASTTRHSYEQLQSSNL